jgi:HK97 family phage portal protein
LRPLSYIKGIFSRSETIEKKDLTLADPAAWELFGAVETIAGPAIGPVSAMKVPAVSAAVTLISTAAGTLPAKLYRNGDEGKHADRKHPAYALVHGWANEWTSAGDLRLQLTRDALLNDKGGFAYVNRVEGRPVELLRLDPCSVSVMMDDETGEPVYLVGEKRKQKRYAWRDVLHLQAPGGGSPVTRAREAIALALVLEQHAARLFSRGGRPSGVLKFPRMLGDETAKRIGASWHAAHAGEASGRTAILEEGGDFTPLAFNSVDNQFLEMRLLQIQEIARAFNIPPTMLFELSRGTWSNTEEMARAFRVFYLRPWLEAWQAAYARVLISPEERDELFFEFVTDDLLTADSSRRAEAYAKYRAMGAMTANEVRAGLNLPPHKDGDRLDNPNITPGKAAANDNAAEQEDAA